MTIVFGPDAFTVTSDTAISSYPSGGAKYAYNIGSGTNLTVNAANDRVQCPTANIDAMARCTDAAMPTGNQEVTCTASMTATSDSQGDPAVRLATDGTANGYIMYTTPGGDVSIYRIDAGTFVQLTTAARGVTPG